ncbi:MAG: hypothetical protein U5K54_11345 [Cytophagales bacterium]|nr:hypothetical protein [Cytophagales bacterium]
MIPEEVRAWLAKNTFDSNPRVLIRQNLQGETNLQPEESFSHLFVHTIGSEEKDLQLMQGFQDFQSADWLPMAKQ